MTTFTAQIIKAPFAAITAGSATLAMTAASAGADVFACTGRDLVLAQNTHASIAYTVAVTSIADEKNRTGDITTYSLAAGEIAMFGVGLTNSPGWKNASTGQITITASNAAVKIAILTLPAGYPS